MTTTTKTIVGRSSSRAVPASCEYGIELTRRISLYDVASAQQAWRMTVTVTDFNNVDPNIFLYDRRPRVGDDDQDFFLAICSPVDLSQYPISNPEEGSGSNFFRMADLDLITRNRDLLETTWDAIVDDVRELIRTLVGICELGDGETIEFGTLEESSSDAELSEELEDKLEDSSESLVCDEDLFTAIDIIESDDDEFPVGATLTETASTGWPTCTRTWELVSAVTGATLALRLVTSIMDNTFELYQLDAGAPTLVDSGGLADGYKAFLHYSRGVNNYTLRIEGA